MKRAIARIQHSDVSAVVSVPEEFDRDELRETLDYVPNVLVQYGWRFRNTQELARTDGVNAGAGAMRRADTNEYLCCCAFVMKQFRRVYGDEDRRVHRCRNCHSDVRLKKGSAADNDVAYPDPQEHSGRNGGFIGGARW